MSWSAEQQRLLSAMGYTLYRQASAAPGPSAAAAIVQEVPMAYAPAPTATNHRLSEALQRAAAGRDVSALVNDLDALRRDPLKKRALWPRLRALRRPH